ncbi:hypothetical protein BU116_13560 [Staphylococcus xylosus]|nr:hypothetical protein BU116_13560 [Staphylococcus xylosus]
MYTVCLKDNIDILKYFYTIFPLLFYKTSYQNPVYFNHLTERLSLLVILLFGEGLVLLIQNIELSHLNIVYAIFDSILLTITGNRPSILNLLLTNDKANILYKRKVSIYTTFIISDNL